MRWAPISCSSIKPQVVYTPFLNDPDPKVVARASLGVAWKDKLSFFGVALRWPPPPLDTNFDHRIQSELDFQLNWSKTLLLMCGELSEKERQSLPLPIAPYTEEAVTDFIDAHQKLISKRNIWMKLTGGSQLSEHQSERLKRIEAAQQESWAEALREEYIKTVQKQQKGRHA